MGTERRLSVYLFEDGLGCGINSMGVDVVQVGPMPTPALAFLTTDMRCDAGVMITASHNPYQDNGIKFFGADGFLLLARAGMTERSTFLQAISRVTSKPILGRVLNGAAS